MMRPDPTTIKQRLGIADVLRAHGLTVRAGRMACPIHAGGNRSSFSIKPGDRYARCWACGWHGDVLGLTMALGGCDFAEALRRCASLAGLDHHRPVHAETRRRLEAEQRAAAEREHAEQREDNEQWRWWANRAAELHTATRQVGGLLAAAPDDNTEQQAWALLGELATARDQAEHHAEEWRLWMARHQ